MKRIMKKVRLCSFVVLMIMLAYWLTYDQKELFRGGAILFEIVYRLCEAFCASVVFFLIIKWLPYKRKLNIVEKNFPIIFCRLIYNISEFIQLIHLGIYNDKLLERLDKITKPDMDVFDKKIADHLFLKKGCFSQVIGSKIVILVDDQDNQHNGVYSNVETMHRIIIQDLSELLMYSECFDDKLVIVLRGILYSDIFNVVSLAHDDKSFKRLLRTRVEDIRMMYSLYSDLYKELEDTGYIDYYLTEKKGRKKESFSVWARDYFITNIERTREHLRSSFKM